MTTHVFSSPCSAGTDALWQAACNEFFGEFETYLTQVPQTGELAYPVAIVRPASGTYAGWRCYRFNDPLQATAPIFIKLWVGFGYNSNVAMKCQIGFELDGSGNFVGTAGSEVLLNGITNSSSSWPPVGGSHPTFTSKQNGFFGIAFKCGGFYRGSVAMLAIGRTTDNNGQPTDEGFFVNYGMGSSGPGSNAIGQAGAAQQCFRFSPQTAYTNGRNSCFIPGYGSNSGSFGGEIEAYLNYTMAPLTKPNVWMAGIYANEFPLGTQFQATMVGASPRTYLSLGAYIGQSTNESLTRNTGFAMIWEG